MRVKEEWRAALDGSRVRMRSVEMEDCGDTYVDWLADPQVNQYLETRWTQQTADRIIDFVEQMAVSTDSLLLAIIAKDDDSHIGNLKIGPVNWRHRFADISYFIGDRSRWGRGFATEAVSVATEFAFTHLGIRYMKAGYYEGNEASGSVLRACGYEEVGRYPAAVAHGDEWVDQVLMGRSHPTPESN